MLGFVRHKVENVPPGAPVRPVLDLSGPRLRQMLEHLAEAAEPTGGIERYVGALSLKASLFEERLGKGRVGDLSEAEFYDLCSFIAPVRRRVGAWLDAHGFPAMRVRLQRLFAGWSEIASADRRLAEFVAGFPVDRDHRWVRDLAAEALHFTAPAQYPLMTRWMWDARTRTGVLREIWHAEDVDAVTIAVSDDSVTFATLRDELEGFLRDNGVFRDLPFYVDLLCAHAYAFYITGRGGRYLSTEFGAREDPLAHTSRLLGLDAVTSEKGRARLKLIDGAAVVMGDQPRLPAAC
jgi:hypothetical protein